jgi:hypothetical protein
VPRTAQLVRWTKGSSDRVHRHQHMTLFSELSVRSQQHVVILNWNRGSSPAVLLFGTGLAGFLLQSENRCANARIRDWLPVFCMSLADMRLGGANTKYLCMSFPVGLSLSICVAISKSTNEMLSVVPSSHQRMMATYIYL